MRTSLVALKMALDLDQMAHDLMNLDRITSSLTFPPSLSVFQRVTQFFLVTFLHTGKSLRC